MSQNNCSYFIDHKCVELEQQCNTLENELKKMQNEHDNIIMRIVGVSDETLKEQLGIDYVNLANKMNLTEAILNNARSEFLAAKLNQEHDSYYINMFNDADPITCLEKTNEINIREILQKKKIREPKSIEQKRELCFIANDLNSKIILIDHESNFIDYIGKGERELKLYCRCFKKYGDIPKTCMYLKYCR